MNMKGYALSLTALVVAVTLMSLLLPKGKTQKTVKVVLSVVILLSVFRPISFILGDSVGFSDYDFLYGQETFSEYAKSYYSALNEKACDKLLCDLGVNGAKVNVFTDDLADTFSTKYAEIDLRFAVIIPKNENIDIIDEAKKSVSAFLGIDEKAVYIIE